jgi:hypothetical protein
VTFVNLFDRTQRLYAATTQPLTINGVHLNSKGNELVAKEIDNFLFDKAVDRETARLEQVRRAAQDKNFHWFNRYRTTDGYSIFGGRADSSMAKRIASSHSAKWKSSTR